MGSLVGDSRNVDLSFLTEHFSMRLSWLSGSRSDGFLARERFDRRAAFWIGGGEIAVGQCVERRVDGGVDRRRVQVMDDLLDFRFACHRFPRSPT